MWDALGSDGTMGGVSEQDTAQDTAQQGVQEGVQEGASGSRRYPRTFGALIGSMLVLLAVVVPVALATHWFGDASRSQADKTAGVTKDHDWVGTVRTVQSAQGEKGVDIAVVYPRSLPSGWYANTDPAFTPGAHPAWAMNFVKGETSYVGLAQAHDSARQLAVKYVDTNPRQGSTADIHTAVGDRWTSWSDSGGDHGYSTSVGGNTLLVWGPKDADLRLFLGLLTTKRLS